MTFSLNLLTVRDMALRIGRSVIFRIVFGDVTFLRTDILGTSPNNPQALEITGLLVRFGLFLLGVLQDER